MKGKGKAKIQSHSGDKRPLTSRFNSFLSIVGQFFKRIYSWLKRNKYPILVALLAVVVCFIWWFSQTWVFQSAFSKSITYPGVSVLGKDLGSLDTNNLSRQLLQLKSDFETRKVTMVNGKKQWVFELGKLGVTFDATVTGQSVLRLNSLSVVDKYRLMTGDISSAILPTISVNNDTCAKALAVIPAVQISSQDASVHYEDMLIIKPDQPGTKFNAVLTCQNLPRQLATNSFIINVSLDVTPANLTKADLEPKISQLQAIVGESLSLKSGNYQLDLTPRQLLSLFDISKQDNVVHVDWSSSKLDELVNSISEKVDTYNSSPALGACQRLISSGGNWLDKTATKKIFTDLQAGKPRSYDLPIVYHAPSVSTINPVAHGSSGTIYLTYDDGMTYGDRIMNYAACYGIKVTFFELGNRVGADAVALRRAIAEGHAVQSHGYEHALFDYGQRSYDWQFNDMKQSIDAITSVTGVRPTYFRPPGGNRSDVTYQAASANGLTLIMWGDASRDSAPSGVTSAITCANVLAGAFSGASVLMHSTNATTPEAMPCIIEGLAARGYNMQALR